MLINTIKSDHIVTPQGVISGYLSFSEGKITYVGENAPQNAETADYTGYVVFPGIVDIHNHGGGGYGFSEPGVDSVIKAADFHLKHGTTSVLPTLAAAPFDVMKRSVENIANAVKTEKSASNILGVHMEGPYCSKKQCGALCSDFIAPPLEKDYKPFTEEFGRFIRRWTYAPENDENGTFCRYIAEHGIIPSAGHTDAVYRDMVTAIDNGCRTVTHLYSCTSTVTRNHGFRSLGVIESAYLRDELMIELISDGKHLPTELFQLAVKIKGTENTLMVSDSIKYAGAEEDPSIVPPDAPTIVEDGVCKLKDRTAFAGSIVTADKMVRFSVREAGFSPVQVAEMLCDNPAKLLGLSKGRLACGFDADIVVFKPDYTVEKVLVAGKPVE